MRPAAAGAAVRRLSSSALRAPAILPDFAAVQAWREARDVELVREHGRTAKIGMVPTMGALHEGHLSLVSALASRVDDIVVSIYVNPAQFAPHEDFGTYPRTMEGDIEKLMALPTPPSAIYTPSDETMYPKSPPFRSYVTPLEADDSGEGAARPGFFRGVATVVTKLFATVRPSVAAFGQKDGYQCIVVRQLARDLNLGVDVLVVPTMRAEDGLALSSRNAYLSEDDRAAAPALYRSLGAVRDAVESGSGWDAAALRARAGDVLRSEGGGRFGEIEYLSVACARTGRPVGDDAGSEAPDGALLVSVAAPLGATRLIDNIVVVPGQPGLAAGAAADYLGR